MLIFLGTHSNREKIGKASLRAAVKCRTSEKQ